MTADTPMTAALVLHRAKARCRVAVHAYHAGELSCHELERARHEYRIARRTLDRVLEMQCTHPAYRVRNFPGRRDVPYCCNCGQELEL